MDAHSRTLDQPSCAGLPRKESIEHEETWLILAGFFLRPGFGARAMKSEWNSSGKLTRTVSPTPANASNCSNIFFGGESQAVSVTERQRMIIEPELPKLNTRKSAAPELIRLAGSLERIGEDTKID